MKHILLVEDDENIREVIRAYLEAGGYRCSEAKDGHAARDWLMTGEAVDLILTDNQMPRLTGLELIDWAKLQSSYLHIPIILYSGHMTTELRKRAMEAGAAAVLEKPFSFQYLLDLIPQLLQK